MVLMGVLRRANALILLALAASRRRNYGLTQHLVSAASKRRANVRHTVTALAALVLLCGIAQAQPFPQYIDDSPAATTPLTATDMIPVVQGTVGGRFTTKLSAPLLARFSLTSDLTLYVNPSTGSNFNNGRSAATPFSTVQFAINTVCNSLDLRGYKVTIDATDGGLFTGTYTENLTLCNYTSDGSNNQYAVTVLATGTTWHPVSGVIVTAAGVPTPWQFAGGTWTSPSGTLFYADIQGFIALNGVTIGANVVAVQAQFGGKIEFLHGNNWTISGSSSGSFAQASQGGQILSQGGVTTIIGTPSWGTAFATAITGSQIYFGNNTFSGSATGTRYSVDGTSSVVAGAGDPNSVLPGNSNGLPYAVPPTAWTPADASGAALSFTNVGTKYTVNNGLVSAYGSFTYPATGDGSNAAISGLPFTVPSTLYGAQPAIVSLSASSANGFMIVAQANTTQAAFLLSTSANAKNSDLSGATVHFMLVYPVQ